MVEKDGVAVRFPYCRVKSTNILLVPTIRYLAPTIASCRFLMLSKYLRTILHS